MTGACRPPACAAAVQLAHVLKHKLDDHPEAQPLYEHLAASDCLGLLISAFPGGYGNPTCIINDPTVAPLDHPYSEVYDENIRGRYNCSMEEVLINGWPFVFLVALRDVAPGEELLLSYGAEYWRGLSAALAQAESTRRACGKYKRRAAAPAPAGQGGGGGGPGPLLQPPLLPKRPQPAPMQPTTLQRGRSTAGSQGAGVASGSAPKKQKPEHGQSQLPEGDAATPDMAASPEGSPPPVPLFIF